MEASAKRSKSTDTLADNVPSHLIKQCLHRPASSSLGDHFCKTLAITVGANPALCYNNNTSKLASDLIDFFFFEPAAHRQTVFHIPHLLQALKPGQLIKSLRGKSTDHISSAICEVEALFHGDRPQVQRHNSAKTNLSVSGRGKKTLSVQNGVSVCARVE